MDLLQLVALQVEFTEGREVTEGALPDTLYLVPAEVQRLDPGGDHGVHLGDAQLPRHHVAAEVQSRQVGEVVRAVLAQTRDGKVVP